MPPDRTYEIILNGREEGNYSIRVYLDGDESHQGCISTTTIKVGKYDSEVTLTGKQNTSGEAFVDGANIEYDPENSVVVNAVNDNVVSNTSWTWQISDTSDKGVVELGETVNCSEDNAVNSEDIKLKTIGVGTVTLNARFSGNNIYQSAIGSISFKVVPMRVQSPIIEILDENRIYYSGEEQKPEVKVYYAEGKLIPADEYEVTYENNISISTDDSTAKVKIKSKADSRYALDAEKEFSIKGVRIHTKPTAGAISYGQTLCPQVSRAYRALT